MTAMKRRAPDVVFIGYYKAGTTMLRAYFDRHPEIVWTRQAHYFITAETMAENRPYPPSVPEEAEGKCFIDMFEAVAIGYVLKSGHEWAQVGFTPGAPVEDGILHSDPLAMAKRIHTKAPEAKILVVIRNQIDWLRSAFLHQINLLPPKARSFADFINTIEGKCVAYAGLYHQTIEAYYEVFGRARVKVMLLEDLAADMTGSLRELCAFLGVDYVDAPPERALWNRGRGATAGSIFASLSRHGVSDARAERIAALLGRLPPLAALLARREVVSAAEKAMLRGFYAVSNYHTQRLTGLDLAGRGYAL